MALKELDELLNRDKLKNFVKAWKKSEARERYLIIAEKAHERLSKLINEWMKDESRMGENFHETFDKELLNPVKIEIDGETYEKSAWSFVWERKISKAELEEKLNSSAVKIISGNPAWSGAMNYFKLLVKDNETAPVDELARTVFKIIADNAKTSEQKFNDVKNAIETHCKQRGIDVEGFGLSRFSSVLHIIDKDNYLHMD